MSDHWTEHTLLRTAHAIEHIRHDYETDATATTTTPFKGRLPQQFYSLLDPSGAIRKATTSKSTSSSQSDTHTDL
jgi:hypothetical protein